MVKCNSFLLRTELLETSCLKVAFLKNSVNIYSREVQCSKSVKVNSFTRVSERSSASLTNQSRAKITNEVQTSKNLDSCFLLLLKTTPK